MYNLEGKVALVTGCASRLGMGYAIARRLASEGADIAANDRETIPARERKYGDWQGLDSVVKEVESLGRRALAVPANITSSREVNDMVAKVLDKFGRIDILVNNAGVTGSRGIMVIDLNEDDWNGTVAVNLNGVLLCSKAVGKAMVQRKIQGKIVTIASVAGKAAIGPGRAAYIASKFGAIGLTQALAVELAPYKINVNAICPGLIETDILNEALAEQGRREGITFEEAKRQYTEQKLSIIPWGRLGKPEEVANAVAFLASNQSDYMTGQAINVCGGWMTAR